jgi:lipoprotein-anchoring transpeptidase ErfK/SrfK
MPVEPDRPNPLGRLRLGGRRRLAVGVAAAILVVGAATGFALAGGGGSSASRVKPKPVITTPSTVPNQGPFTVATTKVPELAVHAQPSTTAPLVITLGARTHYGLPTALLAGSARSHDPPGWVPVVVPLHKPNDTPGWVAASDVTLSETPSAVTISLSQHTLVLLNAGHPVLSTRVIIGASNTRTPTGTFYLTDPVNCNKVSVPGYPVVRCTGTYGAFAIGTSGLSETLDSFDGTIPQIALHGTDLPATELGKDLSNGCVRMPNDIIVQIARLTPLLGTPITITA